MGKWMKRQGSKILQEEREGVEGKEEREGRRGRRERIIGSRGVRTRERRKMTAMIMMERHRRARNKIGHLVIVSSVFWPYGFSQ